MLRCAAVVLAGVLATLVAAVPGAALAADPASYVQYYHHDLLGSPLAVTDENGQVLWYENTDPYGGSLGRRARSGRYLDTVDGNRPAVPERPEARASGTAAQGYTGHAQDAGSGLTYMQARHYDPALGRFLSNDPVGALGTGPGMFNRYGYALNSPYQFVDPDGRQAVEEGSDSTTDDIVAEIQATRRVTTDALDKVNQGMSLAGDATTMAVGGGVVGGLKGGRSLWSSLKRFITGGPKGTAEAAARLGIDLEKVSVVNGVARTTIGQATTLDPKDIQKLKEALKARGANSAQVETGLLANTKLESFLRARAADGRTFQGGLVQHSRTPGSDYTITFGLQ